MHEMIDAQANNQLPPMLADSGMVGPVEQSVWQQHAAIGTRGLETTCKDPAFDPKQRAFHYVRAIEIPTPPRTARDAKFFGSALPKDVPGSVQERACTSPIWYTPG
jgi:Protein of unknown function (DUF3604)